MAKHQTAYILRATINGSSILTTTDLI